MNLRGSLFPKLWAAKRGFTLMPKRPVSGNLWAVNMLKAPNHYLNLGGSIFVIFFDDSERKSARKHLS